jgi:hypothetical protein
MAERRASLVRSGWRKRVLIRPHLRLKTRVSGLQPDHVNEPDFDEKREGERQQKISQ